MLTWGNDTERSQQMSESRRALVLHLVGGGEVIRIAVTADAADQLGRDLPKLLLADTPQTVTAADGTPVVVNFAQVAVALLAPIPALSSVYGNSR
jgi:hypothetical protein